MRTSRLRLNNYLYLSPYLRLSYSLQGLSFSLGTSCSIPKAELLPRDELFRNGSCPSGTMPSMRDRLTEAEQLPVSKPLPEAELLSVGQLLPEVNLLPKAELLKQEDKSLRERAVPNLRDRACHEDS